MTENLWRSRFPEFGPDNKTATGLVVISWATPVRTFITLCMAVPQIYNLQPNRHNSMINGCIRGLPFANKAHDSIRLRSLFLSWRAQGSARMSILEWVSSQ